MKSQKRKLNFKISYETGILILSISVEVRETRCGENLFEKPSSFNSTT